MGTVNGPIDPMFASPTPTEYVHRIRNSRVYDVATRTPLELASDLSRRLENNVLLKREDHQPGFSFKLRGAYNKMAQLTPEQLRRGVICASAGNHAQGVAISAKRLGAQAVIVMPVTAPDLKIDAVRRLGGEVILSGEDYSDAFEHALQLERDRAMTFVHPFDDPDVIAGQGTIAMEIDDQLPGQLDAVFVGVGGGGLLAGVAAYMKSVRPGVMVIGAQMNDSDAMAQSVSAGQRVELADVGLFSDATAVRLVGQEPFRIVRHLVDGFEVVTTDAVCAAIKDVYQETRSIVEPAGALAVAAAKQFIEAHRPNGKTFVAVTCGANMNFDRLRFVAERAEVGEQREALFAVTIPEERGSFRRLCELIGPRAVTEFNYRISDPRQAHVFVGIAISNLGESKTIAESFELNGYPTIDLTQDELAKLHLRHLTGGRSELAQNEHLIRLVFPERPGSLMRFLSTLRPDWNISLFHYRNQGSDYGRVLVGIQISTGDRAALGETLDATGYPWEDESENPIYRLFLRS